MALIDKLYIRRTCPSCVNEFYPGDCEIVSTATPGKVLKHAPQGVFRQRLARLNPEPLTGGIYTLALARRKCPHCGYLLPTNIELAENVTIAIVGDTYSGKTHYIGALIHQIRLGELQQADQHTSFECLTPEVESDYIRDVITPLFVERQSPSSTPMATDANGRPLIYELIISPSPSSPSRRINLILNDTSGEDIAIKERMVHFGRYVLNADGIIFLADPNQMPEIHSLLPPSLQRKASTGRTSSSVLNSIIGMIKSYRSFDSGSRLSIPIAITLTKSDLLKQLVPSQSQYHFLQKTIYDGNINLRDLDVVDEEVRRFLENFGERLLLQVTQNFSKVRFFATSATGYAPDETGVYPSIEPLRCLDPLLWILYELGILRAS